MPRVNINVAKIKRAAQEAQMVYAQAARTEGNNVIRAVGYFDSHPASDIIDTGLLLSRNHPPVRTSPFAVVLRNDARSPQGYPYPLAVALGYTTTSGRQVQGRNWMMEGAKLATQQRVFEDAFRSLYR
ncbi:MAG: hypothetical protein AAFX78_04970 [Cyanobacteria bacterium J06638_20]